MLSRDIFLLLPESEFPGQDHPPCSACEDDPEAPHQVEDGESAQDAEPEPQEHVDFLVYDIDWKNTLSK